MVGDGSLPARDDLLKMPQVSIMLGVYGNSPPGLHEAETPVAASNHM